MIIIDNPVLEKKINSIAKEQGESAESYIYNMFYFYEKNKELSTKLYNDYKNDLEGQDDILRINTNGKNKKEILAELNKSLWN